MSIEILQSRNFSCTYIMRRLDKVVQCRALQCTLQLKVFFTWWWNEGSVLGMILTFAERLKEISHLIT